MVMSVFVTREGAQPYLTWSDQWKGQYDHQSLQAIWEQTHQVLKAGQYTLAGKNISLESLDKSIQGTYKRTISLIRWLIQKIWPAFSSRGYNTKINVVDCDAIKTVVKLKEDGYNPALLNPANAYNPGGGYKGGARAFEEEICRRSGLAFTIDPSHRKVHDFYPFRGAELVYSPEVPIFRHGKDEKYAYMDKPVSVAMITSASINLGGCYKDEDVYVKNHEMFLTEMEKRIYAQLAAAAENGNDSVVLTAFGCGAFQCDPKEIAKLYNKVIKAHFQGVFKLITFSIIDDENAGRKHNPQGNFRPFKEELEAKI